MERVEFDLEEYRALRAEIIQSMDDGNNIFAFCLGAVGLVLGAGLSYKDTFLGFLVLGLFLPILSALVLSMWFAAQERIARASHYLSGAEVRIKSVFGDIGSVSWEAWLRARKPNGRAGHFWFTGQAGIGLFGIIIVSSILMGLNSGGNDVDPRIKNLTIILSSIICGAVFLNVLRRYSNWKYLLSTSYEPET